jgi:hypothetical protein
VAESTDSSTPDDALWKVVDDLVDEVKDLQTDIGGLTAGKGASASSTKSGSSTEVKPPVRRTIPTKGDPVDLDELARWVNSLLVRYGAAGDWLTPCWWRHGLVVEELAALRVAWLGAYNAAEPPDPAAGVKWHEAAEKCRQRIRQTISIGTGCSPGSHRAEDPITNDPRWADELTALRNRSLDQPDSAQEAPV